LIHIGNAWFGGCGDALKAANFKSEGSSKIPEGVMGCDKNPGGSGEVIEFGIELGFEGFEAGFPFVGASIIVGCRSRIDGNEGLADRFGDQFPEIGVHPDMGVDVAAGAVAISEEIKNGNNFGDSHSIAKLGEVLTENGSKASFETQTMEENQICIGKKAEIGFPGTVEMGVEAWSNEGVDGNAISTHDADDIGDKGG
jgi:hypothetical protein